MDHLDANDRPGRHAPSWYAETAGRLPDHAKLDGSARADVCVIGGGYTGLSAALHLARAGLGVVLLEAHRVGWGASGRNGGQLGSGQRVDPDALEARYGADAARRLWHLGEEAKALVKRLVAEEGIDCDLAPGVAHLEEHPEAASDARTEATRMTDVYGYPHLGPLDRDAIRAELGTDAYAGGVLDADAAHLHPLKYALGLAAAALAAGARIHEGTRVTEIDRVAPHRVVTPAGTVMADHVVVACNGYLGGLLPELGARVMPINNFIVATAPLEDRAPIKSGVAASDGRFVVNYWRQSPDGRLLFGGGESYGYRFPTDIAALVRRSLVRVYPGLADMPVTHAWGGTLAITRSRLPALRRIGGAIYAAGGYSGHGVGLATLAGAVMAEAVTGTAGRFDVFARLPQPAFPGGPAFRAPLLALAMSWYALRDRL